MVLFIIGLLTLVAVGFALTLRAVAGLRSHVTERCNSLADLQAEIAEENLLQHRIGRKYLGHELIEKRVLPTIGYREPEKTPVEKWMLETWKRETADQTKAPETN
jgi:hypothetical protein